MRIKQLRRRENNIGGKRKMDDFEEYIRNAQRAIQEVEKFSKGIEDKKVVKAIDKLTEAVQCLSFAIQIKK